MTALVRSRDSQRFSASHATPGEAAALFVDGAADLDRRGVADARAANRFRRKHRGGEAGLHVAGAASVELAVDDLRRRTDRASTRARPARRRSAR